jgi:hypothetical protein
MKQCNNNSFVRLGDVARQQLQQMAEKRKIRTLPVDLRGNSAAMVADQSFTGKVKS